MAFEVENLEATLADLRARGVTFERFEMSGFDVRGDTIAAPDKWPGVWVLMLRVPTNRARVPADDRCPPL